MRCWGGTKGTTKNDLSFVYWMRRCKKERGQQDEKARRAVSSQREGGSASKTRQEQVGTADATSAGLSQAPFALLFVQNDIHRAVRVPSQFRTKMLDVKAGKVTPICKRSAWAITR